jgi:hypothetical protein
MEPLTKALAQVDHPVGLVVIHHAGKSARDWEKAAYGSHGISGGATNILHLQKASDAAPDEGPYVFNAKGRTIRHEQLRLLRRLHYFPELRDPSNPDEESHAFEWILDDRQPSPDTSGLGRTVSAVLRVLEDADGWLPQAEVLRRVEARGIHHTRQVIVRQIEKLIREGMVFKQGSAHRTSYLHIENVPKPETPTRPRLIKKG